MLPRVPLAIKHVEDYLEPAGAAAVERLREAARPFEGARVLHLNSTSFGGGVAELLHAQLPLFRDLGIEAEWALVQGSEEYFNVTKAVHNALQGAEVVWTKQMRDVYWERIRENAAHVTEPFDFVFVHDPQPAGILAVLEEESRRSGKWLWRCHIDLSAPFEPVWSFFEPLGDRVDAAIFTMEDFAQPGLTRPVPAFIPPSIDPLSNKNNEMTPDMVLGMVQHHGIDIDRPLMTQVSRFDPWKDPLGVLDTYRLARDVAPGLQLLMVGSMADDDPEGRHYLELTASHADDDPDVHLLTNLDGIGDLEVNAFQRASDVVVQKSIREGFGLVVAEGMWKAKAVVGGNVGGIRLQIEDGRSGFLVDSVEECAERTTLLLRDHDLRERLGEEARERVRERFLTLREVEDYLRLMARVA
ncbi:MAG: glycosyltransferase [Actinomycetota bacterium]